MSESYVSVRKELVQFLLAQVKADNLPVETAKKYIKEISSQQKTSPEPMAVIGLACRLPDADSGLMFWNNLKNGKDSIQPFPAKRLADYERLGVTGDNRRRGGFLDAIDGFDPEYFKIPPKVAEAIDPVQRMMLEVFVETIEDAGYWRNQLEGKKVGIFVGHDHTHQLMLSYIHVKHDFDMNTLLGSWTGMLASRLSYTLNLKGPAMVLDSSCSASLTALDAAIKSIGSGDCESALVGGANLIFYPESVNKDALSDDDCVRSFDNNANGTVWSEGVAGIFIKPLSKAVSDGDHIYGVVKGIAINHNGKSNGLTAPNGLAQTDVILQAWERAGIAPETISYIEAHGTGSQLADSIEVKGLTEAFSKYTTKKQFCAIGSVKSNMGNNVGASGLTSLIKVLMSMKAEALPPHLHFTAPNRYIDFCNSPVYVLDRLTPWKRINVPRRAGISAFGLSGANCHVVVEEGPAGHTGFPVEEQLYIFPVSADNIANLKRMLLRHLKSVRADLKVSPADRSYTMSTGRKHHNIRLAIVCSDDEQLEAALNRSLVMLEAEALTEGGCMEHEAYLLIFNREQPVEKLRHFSANAALVKAAADYAAGKNVEFRNLFKHPGVRRCSIPPQVFNNRRLWSAEARIPEDLVSVFYQAVNQTDTGSPGERFMVWLWSEILGYPGIQPEDNFLNLGGDSITGAKLMQVINFTFGLELPMTLILQTPVLKDFTDAVNCGGQLDLQLQACHKAEVSVQLPVTPAQHSMYLTSKMEEASAAYHITTMIINRSGQSTSELKRIFQKLSERHQSLRASFLLKGDQVVQITQPEVTVTVEEIFLQSTGCVADDQLLLHQEAKMFIRPFDLGQAPLMRIGHIMFNSGQQYILLDLHHIIVDGTAMGILMNDYLLLTQGQKPDPVSYSYQQAVTAVCERLAKPSIELQKKWWFDQFCDEVPVLNLPIDRGRPKKPNHQGAVLTHVLSHDLLRQLKTLAGNSQTTLFTILLGSYYLLLSRLSNEEDIVIGVPVTGRNDLRLQNVVGMFVNTLPVRIRGDFEKTFTEFIKNLRQLVMECFENQDFSYDLLVDSLEIQRSSDHNPLFDVYFSLQNVDMGLENAEENTVPFSLETAKFDLTVTARETVNGLLMEWEYAKALFDTETIQTIMHRYEYILAQIAGDSELLLKNIELTDETEKQQLIIGYNQNTRSLSNRKGVVEYFQECAVTYSDRPAVLMEHHRWTYQELNTRANIFAHNIAAQGIPQGSAVGLMLNRSPDMIAAILGVLKSGCFYVPLDNGDPEKRLTAIIRDAGIRLLITEKEGNKIINARTQPEILWVEELDESISVQNPEITTGCDSLAYLMYTSGTTGEPKGTLIRQRSIIRVVRDTNYLDIWPEDVLLQLSSYCFDGSVFDIYGALLNGAALVLIPQSQVADLDCLSNYMVAQGVTVSFFTTALFNAIIDHKPMCLAKLRRVLFGGEAVSPYHVEAAYQYLGPGKLIHVYGPTETTVFALAFQLDHPIEAGRVPIGRPISETTAYIINKHGKLQPRGVIGELLIGGTGLSDGYLNKQVLTNEKFIANPCNPEERVYRTGDLVFMDRNGLIHYAGRADQQIKLRGFRIELKEIEGTALRHEDIREAYADLHMDGSGRKVLCLWVVPKSETELHSKNDVKLFLAAHLPQYMVPNFIIEVGELPRNRNGKIDVKALPKMELNRKKQIHTPRNAAEELLAAIWKENLGIEEISIDDNFFELGGDSIKAIQVVAALQRHNYRALVSQLIEKQTIQEFSELLVPTEPNTAEAQTKQVSQEDFDSILEDLKFE